MMALRAQTAVEGWHIERAEAVVAEPAQIAFKETT